MGGEEICDRVQAVNGASHASVEPRYSRMAHRVTSRDINQSFAPSSTLYSLSLLVQGELWFASEPHSTLLRTVSALTCPGQDEMPFKLRKPSQHRHHQLAVRTGRKDHRGI
jgi:hypothetical protein